MRIWESKHKGKRFSVQEFSFHVFFWFTAKYSIYIRFLYVVEYFVHTYALLIITLLSWTHIQLKKLQFKKDKYASIPCIKWNTDDNWFCFSFGNCDKQLQTDFSLVKSQTTFYISSFVSTFYISKFVSFLDTPSM